MLSPDWKPEFGLIYTWLAADKHGSVAVFVNNNFGNIPSVLLALEGVERRLDDLTDFLHEESEKYEDHHFRKNGETVIDMYSSWQYKRYSSVAEINAEIQARVRQVGASSTEYSFPAFKGVYVYHAVEGYTQGEDYPEGFDGETAMGDYFRFLMPTVLAGAEDFPSELRRNIAKSEDVDFSDLKIVYGDDINRIFNRLWR